VRHETVWYVRRSAARGAPAAVALLVGATPSFAADSPDLAVAPNGNANFAWQRFDGAHIRVQERRRTPSGTLEDGQDLSALGQDAVEAQVAIAPDATAIFVWTRSNGTNFIVQARTRTSDGALGPVQNLSAPGQDASDPQVAVDPNGNASFVWRRSNGTNGIIQTRRRLANGTLEPTQGISSSGQHASEPQVAVAADGAATFVWTRSNGTNRIVQTRRRLASGSFGATQDLSAVGQDAGIPQVAVEPDDKATFIWTRSNGTNRIAQTRRRLADGTLEATQDLSAAGQSASDPHLAVDSGGNASLVWTRPNGTFFIIQARRRLANGTLENTQNLSASGGGAFDSRVAVAPDGVVTFAWRRNNGTDFIVQTRRRLSNGTLDNTQNLSAPGASATGVDVDVGPSGTADYVWQRAGVIQTRRRTSPTQFSATVTLSD